MVMLFYYLALYHNEVLVTSLCVQLHFSGKRGKQGRDGSALPMTKKKRLKEKVETTSALRRKMDTHIICGLY